MKVWIGIDPGMTGACGIISEHQSPMVLDVMDYEEMDWAQLNFPEVFTVNAMIEKALCMPGQGISSTGKFMQNYGEWIGAMRILNIPLHIVTPAKWKKAMFDSAPKGDKKEMSRDLAKRLFPSLADKLKRKKDHNRAEALLLASYCQRLYS